MNENIRILIVGAGDPQVQRDLVPFIAATKAHILIKGTTGGQAKTFRIETGVFFDEAAKALELFDAANVGVAYATATGALQLVEGQTKAGVVWPEELDAARFIALANTLGLTLNLQVN